MTLRVDGKRKFFLGLPGGYLLACSAQETWVAIPRVREPLGATQLIEKFLSNPMLRGPNGLVPPGNPSIEVGRLRPPPQFMGLPEPKRFPDIPMSRRGRPSPLQCPLLWVWQGGGRGNGSGGGRGPRNCLGHDFSKGVTRGLKNLTKQPEN